MEISALLGELRAAHPGCLAVAYADLGAGMILADHSALDLPQERWDDLCATAVHMLAGAGAAQAAPLVDPGGQGAGVTHAIILDGADLAVFVKSQANPVDALACLCAQDLPLTDFLTAAQALLGRIDPHE